MPKRSGWRNKLYFQRRKMGCLQSSQGIPQNMTMQSYKNEDYDRTVDIFSEGINATPA